MEIKFKIVNAENGGTYGPYKIEDIANQDIANSLYNSSPYKSDLIKSNLTFLQYTGFKDANGREIYDGDKIVFHPHGIGTVCFNDDLHEWLVSFKGFEASLKNSSKYSVNIEVKNEAT